MLERLLELFFHAKSGVFAAVFLVGTTGALVTATVSNGVATITITQASASPSASASASASATASATASPSHSPSSSPSHSPSTSPSTSPAAAPVSGSESAGTCSDEAHDAADAVKTVNAAFSQFHNDLMHLRTDNKGDAGKAIVSHADTDLKVLRQNAVKDIHATSTCARKATDDENENEDNDEDNDHEGNDHKSSSREGNFVVVLLSNLQSFFGSHNVTVNTTTASASPSTTTVTGSDPKTIADEAVAAMQAVFDDAKSQLDALATASPRAKASKSPQPLKTNKHSDSHGREHGDDD